MGTLAGKTALVTGGSRGIGRAIALRLAAEGADVALCARQVEAAQAVAGELQALGVRALARPADVAQSAQAGALIEAVLAEWGRLDILVNNAGITRDNLLLRMSEEEWDAVLDTNLKGAFNCCKAAARSMVRARSGRIINISSVVGLMGNAGQANYAASKAGLIGFTKSLAKELASRSIRVNVVAPGFIRTPMTDELTPEAKQGLLAQIPLGRFGEAQEIADVCSFLASDASKYITGQVLRVDGGMMM